MLPVCQKGCAVQCATASEVPLSESLQVLDRSTLCTRCSEPYLYIRCFNISIYCMNGLILDYLSNFSSISVQSTFLSGSWQGTWGSALVSA